MLNLFCSIVILSEIIPFLLFEILIVERLGFFRLCFKFVFAFVLSLFCKEPKSGETFTCISMVSSRLSFLSVGLLIDRRRTQDLIDFKWLFVRFCLVSTCRRCQRLEVVDHIIGCG